MHCFNHQLNLNVANTFKMTSAHNSMEKIRQMTVFQLITDKGRSFTGYDISNSLPSKIFRTLQDFS